MRYLVLCRDLWSQVVETIDRSWCLRREAHGVVQTLLQVSLTVIGEVLAGNRMQTDVGREDDKTGG
jgi:hypothetical protein